MAISFVAQAENSFGSDTSPLATTSTLTLAAGDLVEVIVVGTTSATIVVSDGTNSYVAQGGTLASISPFQMYAFVAQNCAAGAVTVTATASVGGSYGIYARQIRGAATTGAVIGVASNYQNSPAATANSIVSGNIAVGVTPTNVLLTGICFNAQNTTPEPTAGTSPLAFTANTSVWATFGTNDPSLPEYLRIAGATGNVQATFGCGGGGLQFSNVLTVAVAYAEASASPIIQSASSASALSDPWPTSISVTLSGVTAGNAILIVTPAVINTTGSPTLTITDSVNSVTDLKQLASFGLSSVYSILDFSIIPNASGGTHTLTATVGSGTGYGFIVAAEISGLNSSAALDVFSLNSAGGGSNPSTGNTGVPASVSEIAIAAVSAYESSVVTIGEPSGYTNIAKYQAGGGYVQYSVDYLTPVALSAQSASWTGLTGVNTYVAGVIVLKAASNQATVMWWS